MYICNMKSNCQVENVLDMFKDLNNISNYPHKCLTAAIIYNNWLDGDVLYDGDHVVFKTKDKVIDNKGYYLQNIDSFIPIEKYGKEYLVNAFSDIDWSKSLYKNFKNKLNG